MMMNRNSYFCFNKHDNLFNFVPLVLFIHFFAACIPIVSHQSISNSLCKFLNNNSPYKCLLLKHIRREIYVTMYFDWNFLVVQFSMNNESIVALLQFHLIYIDIFSYHWMYLYALDIRAQCK